MANRKKRPSYGTAKQKDVEALMGALLTQIRAEIADAVNLGLRRHDERMHTGMTIPGQDLYVPEPSKLIGLNGEPL